MGRDVQRVLTLVLLGDLKVEDNPFIPVRSLLGWALQPGSLLPSPAPSPSSLPPKPHSLWLTPSLRDVYAASSGNSYQQGPWSEVPGKPCLLWLEQELSTKAELTQSALLLLQHSVAGTAHCCPETSAKQNTLDQEGKEDLRSPLEPSRQPCQVTFSLLLFFLCV